MPHPTEHLNVYLKVMNGKITDRIRFMWPLWTAALVAVVYSGFIISTYFEAIFGGGMVAVNWIIIAAFVVLIYVAIRTLLGSRAYAKAFAVCCVIFAIIMNIVLFWIVPWNTVSEAQSIFGYMKNIFIFEWPVLLAGMVIYSLQCWEDEDAEN